jgi:PadR family transcriptional regulator PadR
MYEMAKGFLGGLELLVLLAVIQLGDESYGVPIAEAIEKGCTRPVALSSVYVALGSLARKGLVVSRRGEPTAERGGRAKIHFQVTPAGLREARRTHRTLKTLWEGVAAFQGARA